MFNVLSMPRKSSGRDRSLRVTVSSEELAMLHALADERGVTVSDVVRIMTRDLYLERFGTKKVKPHPKE